MSILRMSGVLLPFSGLSASPTLALSFSFNVLDRLPFLDRLPIDDPVTVFLVIVGIMLVAPLLFERLGLPGIVGLILAGMAVGPHGANLLARDETIVLLGTVGLLFLMFLGGLETSAGRDAPQDWSRILVPVANAETEASLLEMAISLSKRTGGAACAGGDSDAGATDAIAAWGTCGGDTGRGVGWMRLAGAAPPDICVYLRCST